MPIKVKTFIIARFLLLAIYRPKCIIYHMESWFIYAILSAVFTGLGVFAHKVAVERGYKNTAVTIIGDATIILLALLFYAFWGFGSGLWILGTAVAMATGFLYVLALLSRMEAMKNIDTAIFLPLYKTASPLVAIFIGILFFHEWFSKSEVFGMVLGIVVPLLLIHKSEHARQNNLPLGVVFMLMASLLTVSAQALAKYGTHIFENIFLFVALSTFFSMLGGLVVHFFFSKDKNRQELLETFKHPGLIAIAVSAGFMQFLSYSLVMFAYKDGSLAIVYTINSFYILIPIILSIIFYKEHFNLRKALAIGLSILAILFLN